MTDAELIARFRPWIAQMARKYQNVSSVVGFDDLESVGMMACITGRDTFKEGMGAKFETHVMSTVKYKMLDEVNNNMRMKRSRLNLVMAIARADRELGPDATPEQVREWSKKTYAHKTSELSPERVRRVREETAARTVSLDKLVEVYPRFLDRHGPSDEPNLEEWLDRKRLVEKLERYLRRLSIRERAVVNARRRGVTLRAIARDAEITYQRVLQIENKAIAKLKKMHEGNR